VAIFVSTACLKGENDLIQVLESYQLAGFRSIELGSLHKYSPDITDYLWGYKADFLVHHYFPPPLNPFMVNLASTDRDILTKSLKQIKSSLELCSKLGVKLFSFHAGFRADPSPGITFIGHEPEPYERALGIFIDSVRKIDVWAKEYNIKLAVENNVLAKYNIVNGDNPYLLLCCCEEFEEFFRQITSDNVGILLDLGHLQVTAHNLGFNKDGFIDKLEDKVFALHIHDNHGEMDEHLGLNIQSWACQAIYRKKLVDIPWILESSNLSLEEIRKNFELLTGLRGRLAESGGIPAKFDPSCFMASPPCP